MEKEQLNELIETYKLALEGYWLPMAIIAGMFTIIVLLLIAFWRKSESYHHEKHKENSEFRKEYEKQMLIIGKIHENHEIRIEHLEVKKK
jgi:uncharacterized membrane protein